MSLCFLAAAALVAPLAACAAEDEAPGGSGAEKQRIYLNMSYSGNNWQDEAANLAKAIATAPEYAAKYEFETVISGTDVQKQISDIQSMIGKGAKLIVSYPLSPTALDQVVTQGCEQGVTFVFYDSTVNAPCAYNVSFITSAFRDDPERAFYGAQSAQGIVDALGGQGKVVINRGVAGTATDNVHYDTMMQIFNANPGIEVVAEFYGDWNAQVSQQEMAKVLAAHPEVDAVWSADGEPGVIKALEAVGKKAFVTGNGSAYLMRKMAEDGWKGIASSATPGQGGIAMKLGLHILENGPQGVPANIEVPLPWQTQSTAKLCQGNEFVDGCNYFKDVDDTYIVSIYDPDLLPEASLTAAQTGAGIEKITPLPDLAKFEQPPQRRIYTRGACDDGWHEGVVEEGQIPAGLKGCVKD
ncbi:MAG: ABC transporter substrate-binding protein [Bifidobacteriaceae bacterium]|jgi:ribose transport system substrate-binding protein|nr:ABC transporter substrate-binding protein [Bifidobacteriaceae bacterium]